MFSENSSPACTALEAKFSAVLREVFVEIGDVSANDLIRHVAHHARETLIHLLNYTRGIRDDDSWPNLIQSVGHCPEIVCVANARWMSLFCFVF